MKIVRTFLLFILTVVAPMVTGSGVTNDFKWLKEFSILFETVIPDHWEKDKKIGFDSLGRVTVNKQSNPVTVSQYALVCFDYYRKTNDEKYKKAFLNQVSYLLDEKNYNCIDDNRIGYPYRTAFHDLKPDWYSGLAQGEAISVLIRYYFLTKDQSILPLIVKLKNFMLSPMEDKGLLAKTPEGNIWIEEYPNSKQHKHVLNGFMISIFCLYEYCKLFPDDKESYEVYQKCLNSLKVSVDFYDTGAWLFYDRGNKGTVNNWYMKVQVIEMKNLYTITNDDFFKNKMIQWSTYAYNKPVNYTGCIINNVNFSTPLEKDCTAWMIFKPEMTNLINTTVVRKSSGSPAMPNHTVSTVIDNSLYTSFSPLQNDTVKEIPFIELLFNEEKETNLISVTLMKDKSTISFLSFEYKAEENGNWKKLVVTGRKKENKKSLYQFEKVKMKGLRLNIDTTFSSKPIEIAEVNIHDTEMPLLTNYVHRISEQFETKGENYVLNFEAKNSEESFVFYRAAKVKGELGAAKWKFLTTKIPYTSKDTNAFSQFLIVLKPKSDKVALGNLQVKN